jgi:adenylyltransferase/sulfurtransferase
LAGIIAITIPGTIQLKCMAQKNQMPVSDVLSQQEIRRYSLQISGSKLGIEGQEKLKRAKVLVVGAGGKGSSVLQLLTSVGIGTIGISDNFPVQENDLSRQHLYGNGDLGKQKAIVAREKLSQINNFTQFRLHNVCLSEQNISRIARDYEILVDATDNFQAHYLLNDASIELNKPLIFGKIIQFTGMVSVFNYRNGPSVRCAFPDPVKDTPEQEMDNFSCQAVLLNLVGSIMANETIKTIVGLPTVLNGNLLQIDLGKYSTGLLKVEKNPANF